MVGVGNPRFKPEPDSRLGSFAGMNEVSHSVSAFGGLSGHSMSAFRDRQIFPPVMSAFGGKADVRELPAVCPLIARSGHSICQFTASADSLQMPSGVLFKDVLVALDSPAIGSENVGI